MGLEIINQLKKKKNLTNEELSQLSGVPLGTLGKITSGVTKDPKLETLKALARVLGCTLEDFDDNKKDHLSSEEKTILKKYRVLDEHGKEIVGYILNKEYERILSYEDESQTEFTSISLYDMPASAGTGVFLDSNNYEMIDVPLNNITASASFAVRVKGDSMEPQYKDGDIVFVKIQPSVLEGEIGIFILNGEGYIKKCGNGRLISLNEKYNDIVLNDYDELYCKGKVIGKL
jgi:phage repressor protein C with HTH and peptisase S24 domain